MTSTFGNNNMTRFQSILYILTVIVAIGSTVVVTKWVSRPESDYRELTVQEIFEQGSGWRYTTITQMGAYSWFVGMQDNNGEVLYLELRYPSAVGSYELLGSKRWSAFLWKSYHNHSDIVEVPAGSSTESRLLEILEDAASHRAAGCNWLEDRSTIMEIVKTREPGIFKEMYDPVDEVGQEE